MLDHLECVFMNKKKYPYSPQWREQECTRGRESSGEALSQRDIKEPMFFCYWGTIAILAEQGNRENRENTMG